MQWAGGHVSLVDRRAQQQQLHHLKGLLTQARELTMVEAQFGLGEAHWRLLRFREAAKARNRRRIVLKHIAERDVVVSNLLRLCEALVGGMLSEHARQQVPHLHHVVHCSQGKHGSCTIRIDLHGAIRLRAQHAAVDHELMKRVPVLLAEELLALIGRCLINIRRLFPRLPRGLVDAEGEAQLAVEAAGVWHAVQIQAHQPVDAEERACSPS
eukprot:1113640-Prymnesium_polylepis.1